MNSTDRLWYVQLADGDVHRVTLDQLDEGFQAGHIDQRTMVLAAGASRWTPLGQLAGIDESDSQGASPANAGPAQFVRQPLAAHSFAQPLSFAEPAAPLIPSYLNSHRPVSVDLGDLEVAAGLPRRSSKRWFVAGVVVMIVATAGGVLAKRPSWIEPYWRGIAPEVIAMKSWAEHALPSLVRRVRRIVGK